MYYFLSTISQVMSFILPVNTVPPARGMQLWTMNASPFNHPLHWERCGGDIFHGKNPFGNITLWIQLLPLSQSVKSQDQQVQQ